MSPRKVATPTCEVLLARSDTTTAPSMPIKTHRVTSIVLLTWPSMLPKCSCAPQKSYENMPALIATAMAHSATVMVPTFSTLDITFRTAARLTPDNTTKFIVQISNDAPIKDGQLLPLLKMGKK